MIKLIQEQKNKMEYLFSYGTLRQQNVQLENFGRKGRLGATYLERVVEVMRLLAERGIPLKIHSVVGKLNHRTLPEQINSIWKSVEESSVEVKKWKFYQYMSYDDPERDRRHMISLEEFEKFISNC